MFLRGSPYLPRTRSSPTHLRSVCSRAYLFQHTRQFAEKRRFWEVVIFFFNFQLWYNRKREKNEQTTRRKSTNRRRIGLFALLATGLHVALRATYYRRSHVGAQRPIIVFPPSRAGPSGGNRAWEWFYLEWITRRIVTVMAGFDDVARP